MLTNADGAENFKLMVAPAASAEPRGLDGRSSRTRDDVRLADVDAFAGHLVLSERADGLEQLRVVPVVDGDVASRRARRRDARRGVLGVDRREPRVRHDDTLRSATRRSSPR